MLGLLDAGLAVGRTCAHAFARHSADRDGGCRGDEIPDLNDATDGVRPIRNDSVEQVGHSVPFDVINIVGLAVAVSPTLALFDVFFSDARAHCLSRVEKPPSVSDC